MKYLVKIAYLGEKFFGFQYQPGRRTVQGELNRVCKQVFGGVCRVTGCSRTDRGVSAKGFCISIEPPEGAPKIPARKLPLAALPFLPRDLVFVSARVVPDSFHPRYDVKTKEYRYTIRTSPVPDPFLAGQVWEYPVTLPQNALPRMREAAKHFLGKHDFAAFMAQGSDVKDTERTIFGMNVSKKGKLITVSVTGDGFLYNMVRIIAGTLLDVGAGKLDPDDIPSIIRSKERKKAGVTAPPEGLCLWKVTY